MKIKQAVILAGGLGVRLRPLTNEIPKPMAPVNGRPFLEYLFDLLKRNSLSEVVLLLGYLPEKFTSHFGNGQKFGLKISYSIGRVEDRRGTRIRQAKDLLDEHFLLLYGDNYWPMNLSKMIDFYQRKKTLALATVYNNQDGFGEYGWENNMYVNGTGLILTHDEFRQNPRLNGVNIGFFILNKKVIDLMPQNNFSFEEVILPQLASQRELAGYRTDEHYYTITNQERLSLTEEYFKKK